MELLPTALELQDDGAKLKITWNDGHASICSVKRLRDQCPCATCREKRRAPATPELLPVLSVEETLPMQIAKMQPVGRYAYGISFSDGHDTGIFTFEKLRELEEQS